MSDIAKECAISESPILEINSSFKGSEFYTEDFSKIYPTEMARKAVKSKSIPAWTRRLQARLTELGWSVAELARRMRTDPDQAFLDSLYKYVRGDVKQPRGEMLKDIADAVGMNVIALQHGDVGLPDHPSNVHRLMQSARVKTLGEVAANVFRDITVADQTALEDKEESPLPPDPRFPPDAQYDLVIRGTSINRFAPDGYRLRVLDVRHTSHAAQDGDYVIVKRSRDAGQMVETTAKRYRVRGTSAELWPDSDDDRWQSPLVYAEGSNDADTVEIVGLVLFAYQLPRTRR